MVHSLVISLFVDLQMASQVFTWSKLSRNLRINLCGEYVLHVILDPDPPDYYHQVMATISR
jgi:hypothetical protein